MKIIRKSLWVILCIIVFIIVFAISLITKLSSITGIGANSFTLQNAAVEEARYHGEIARDTLSVSYITNEGVVDTRQIIICKPEGAEGDIPLIYIPHYALDENTAEFQQYMNHGWAVASPVFEETYNGQLTGNDLVFNNAALYTLRHMEGIDKQRIAIVGGSAGGYMALMLSELQMGTCATIANSPIANVYFNLYVHFKNCDDVNRNAGIFDIPIPIQLLVSKSFRINLDNFQDASDADRWAALSPIGNARCFSNPTVINHYTGDILVPVDQITKRYTHTELDSAFPDDFTICMADDYPGILSRSLEEEAYPEELSVECYKWENSSEAVTMPYSDRLLTINIFDDGPISPKGSHTAPDTIGSMDTMAYLEEMLERGLGETEKAVPEKILLMLQRYMGESTQLPAYEGIDNSLYGSKAVCQSEIIDEMRQYMNNRSMEELETAVNEAIDGKDNEAVLMETWYEIKDQVRSYP